MAALEAKFCNDVGFNYIAFLKELQPVEPPKFMYEARLEELRITNTKGKIPELNVANDLEGVFNKIKTKVIFQINLTIKKQNSDLVCFMRMV